MRVRKWGLPLLTAWLVIMALSACGTSNSDNTASNTSGTNTNADTAATTNEPATNNSSKDEPAADGKQASNLSKDPVTITWFLGTQTPEDKKLTEATVKKFQEKYPNITIKITYQENPDVLTKQQLAAGGGPDIVQTDGPTTLKEMATAGYLIPLDEYSSLYDWEGKFYPWSLKSVKYNGHLMGVPGAYEALLVYYNKDMFKKNGWEVPTTFQEVLDLCAKIQEKKLIPFAFGASGYPAINEWWLTMAYNQSLGAEGLKKVLKGEEPWNSPAMEEATTKLVDMWQKGYINEKKTGAITNDNAGTLFHSGKAAMIMEGTWALNNHVKDAKFDWGMFQMPAWQDGVQANFPMGLGDATGINKKAKNPAEVAAFLDFLNSEEEAKASLVKGAFRPINGIDINSVSDVDPHVAEAYKLLNDAMANNQTGYVSWTYWPPKASTYAWSNIETVYYGQTDVKTYLANVAKEFDKDKADNKLFDFGD